MNESGHSVIELLHDILSASKGSPPPADTIKRLGGWQRVADDLPGTLRDPVSVVLVRIIARDAHVGGEDAVAALPAVADAVLAIESPTGFAGSVEALLASPVVMDAVADRLADGLLAIVTAYTELRDPSAREVARSANALEAVTRIKIGGYGSPFGLLAVLERFRAPVPKRLAAAVVRSVGTAVDHWPHAVTLTSVVEAVAGLTAPQGIPIANMASSEFASDASWVLANIELVQALRADTQTAMIDLLDSSVRYLTLGAESYDRDDAKILAPIVGAVSALTRAEPGVETFEAALPAPGDLARLVEQQALFILTSTGLTHWYADVKRQSMAAWVALVEDLDRARGQLALEAFYRPEAAIDDLLEVYQASRSVEVVRRVEDFNGVLDVVQPLIEAGFASKSAFVANLDVYTQELAKRLDTVEGYKRSTLLRQHSVAAQVLSEARTILARGESPGKGDGGAAAAPPLPRRLDQIFGSDAQVAAKLLDHGQETLARMEAAVENLTVGRRPSLQEDRVLTDLIKALSASPDYLGEVKAAIDEIVLQMVRFLSSRQNAQESRKPYLFDPDANEASLHEDLFDYLWSALGPSVDIEVQQVGGGRADLRVKYAGFSVYLELKADDTMKPLSEKGAYLNQAVTYQATDVRIGFVVALRVKAFPQAGAHPHLTSLFTHATVDVSGDDDPRHLVLVEVPGNRSSPAAKRAKP